MEIALLTAGVSLTLFAILAFYDGFVLHIFKYRLYRHPESRMEHLTHTIRAVLFPFIAFFLFIRTAAPVFGWAWLPCCSMWA